MKVLDDIEIDSELIATKQAVVETLKKSIVAHTELLHAIDYRDQPPSSFSELSSLTRRCCRSSREWNC